MKQKFFVHPNGLCESTQVGERTRIWAFAHVLPGARIGADCNICDNTFIENDVVLGDRVTVKCGVQLWDGLRCGDDVFIGPNATFTNDHFPRSKQRPEKFLPTIIQQGASIGANATILPGITIGRNAMVGAGAVVTASVPPNAIVTGNPAQITGYVTADRDQKRLRPLARPARTEKEGPTDQPLSVKGVVLHRLPLVEDLRGLLTVGNFEREVPFPAKRYFMVFGVPNQRIRGEHAHRECHQFLICASGSCHVVCEDGRNRAEIVLNAPNLGLYIPPMTWAAQYKYTKDCVLIVFASHAYDSAEYIRDYDEYCRLMADHGKKAA